MKPCLVVEGDLAHRALPPPLLPQLYVLVDLRGGQDVTLADSQEMKLYSPCN